MGQGQSDAEQQKTSPRVKCQTAQGTVFFPFEGKPLIALDDSNCITEEILVYDGELGKRILLLRNVLSEEECSGLISCSEADGFESLETLYRKSYRNNGRIMVDDEELTSALYSRMQPFINRYVFDWAETRKIGLGLDGDVGPMRGLNERLRICKYNPGGLFQKHRDAIANIRGLRSRFTVMLYLNDVSPENGGSTRFYATAIDGDTVAAKIQPVAGMVVIFPHDYLHDGEELFGGLKYIMRSDVMFDLDPE